MADKRIVELRALAQAKKVNFTFADTKDDLIYKIEFIAAEEKKEEPPPQIDVPKKQINRVHLIATNIHTMPKTLQPLVDRGLVITITDDEFHFRFKEREDSGNLFQPLKNIVKCAERLLS